MWVCRECVCVCVWVGVVIDLIVCGHVVSDF